MPEPGGVVHEELTRRRARNVSTRLSQVDVDGNDLDVLAATLDLVERYLDRMEARRRAA